MSNPTDDRDYGNLIELETEREPETRSHLFDAGNVKELVMKYIQYIIGAIVVVAGLGLIFLGVGEKENQTKPMSGVATPAAPSLTSGTVTGEDQTQPQTGLTMTKKTAHLPATNPKVILRLHGSNIEGIRLAPALAAAYLQQMGATETVIVTTNDPVEEYIQGYLPKSQEAVAVEIFAHGSSTSFSDLVAQKADIAMSSIPIKPKFRKDLKPLFGDVLSDKNEIVVGSDGLAIIVHQTNPVDSLTTKQIAGLLSGDIADWSQVGGNAGPVNVHARDELSGAYDTIQHMVLNPYNKRLSNSAKRYDSVIALANAVANDLSGIGFVGLPFAQRAKTIAVADSDEIVPILPTPFTVATEDYPLTRRLYFYVSEQSENPHVHIMANFALSQKGQTIVEKEGFVSHILHTARPAITQAMPEDYILLTRVAERLSLNFRFKLGSSELDAKSKHDIERLLSYMQARPNKKLMLFGFTDSLGSENSNLKLSVERATKVKRILAERNVDTLLLKGFGEKLPVASNNTDDGRHHNRRVEVWIK